MIVKKTNRFVPKKELKNLSKYHDLSFKYKENFIKPIEFANEIGLYDKRKKEAKNE